MFSNIFFRLGPPYLDLVWGLALGSFLNIPNFSLALPFQTLLHGHYQISANVTEMIIGSLPGETGR